MIYRFAHCYLVLETTSTFFKMVMNIHFLLPLTTALNGLFPLKRGRTGFSRQLGGLNLNETQAKTLREQGGISNPGDLVDFDEDLIDKCMRILRSPG